jgi:hypothetical protein
MICTNEIFDEFLAKDGHMVFIEELCDESMGEGNTNVEQEYILTNSTASMKDLVTRCLFVNAAGFMQYLGDNLVAKSCGMWKSQEKLSEDLLGNAKLKMKHCLKRKRVVSELPFARPLPDRALGSVVQLMLLPLAIQAYDTPSI